MIVLGLSGGFEKHGLERMKFVPEWFCHDSAAALVKNGEVLSCIEQERLDRVKHSNSFPSEAIRSCLSQSGVTPSDIDHVAYYYDEAYADTGLQLQQLDFRDIRFVKSKSLITDTLNQDLGFSLTPDRVHFMNHHLTHATMAAYQSGFDSALIAIFDGNGERDSTSIYDFSDGALHLLHREPIHKSIGHFYVDAIAVLGYERFEEYKAMGLASYGTSGEHDKLFDDLVQLTNDGSYEIKARKVTGTYSPITEYFIDNGMAPLPKDTEFLETHKNFAHSLQKKVEEIALHMLRYWKDKTGHKNLCLAGGVAHNCSMNGRLADAGLFERMFVHPASHDGGASLGAAMAFCQANQDLKPSRLKSVSWGPHICNQATRELVKRHSEYVTIKASGEAVFQQTAQLISEGKIIGWARGGMEFGPRALGFRSILADPRPPAMKDKVNEVIKLRESYRPFAPMVLQSQISDWFELPKTECNFEFMVFKVPVREEKKHLLGAVTHVDGSARIQAVNENTPDIVKLIGEFAAITSVPVLLNTSFNVNAEPIVCSEQDALQCFLLTDIDYLVLGDCLLAKRELDHAFLLQQTLQAKTNLKLTTETTAESETMFLSSGHYGLPCSREIGKLYRMIDGKTPLNEVIDKADLLPEINVVVDEIRKFMNMRMFTLVL